MDGCGGIWFGITKQDLCLLLRAEELSPCLYTCMIGKGKICPACVIFVSCGLQPCNPRGKEARGCPVGPAWGAAFLPPSSKISWLVRMLGAGTEQPVPTSAHFLSLPHARLTVPRAIELPLACQVWKRSRVALDSVSPHCAPGSKRALGLLAPLCPPQLLQNGEALALCCSPAGSVWKQCSSRARPPHNSVLGAGSRLPSPGCAPLIVCGVLGLRAPLPRQPRASWQQQADHLPPAGPLRQG